MISVIFDIDRIKVPLQDRYSTTAKKKTTNLTKRTTNYVKKINNNENQSFKKSTRKRKRVKGQIMVDQDRTRYQN